MIKSPQLEIQIKKYPALPTLICGTVVGGLFAIFFQWQSVVALANDAFLGPMATTFKGLLSSMFFGYSSSTGNQALDALLTKGGMTSMLNTVGLIINAMAFGGAMARAGLLERIVAATLNRVKSTGGLITATVGTCLGTNVLTADQYLRLEREK